MKRLSLRHQLGAIFLGFLLLVLSSVAVTFWLVQTQQNDAALINLAGRQRMLLQQMTRLALTDPDNPELRQTIDRFEQTLAALAEGREVVDGNGRSFTLSPPTSLPLQAQLSEITIIWPVYANRLTPPINEVRLQTDFETLLLKLDTVVTTYELLAQTKINRLRWVQFIFLVAAFLLLAWGYYVVRRKLIQPLTDLDAVARAFSSGSLDTPVPRFPHNEMGRLGQTMETMRGEIAAYQQSLEQQVAQRTQELTAAFEFSQEIVRELEPAQLLQAVVDHTRNLMHGNAASLCVLDGNGRSLELVAGSGAGSACLGLRQSTARGLALPVIHEHKTVIAEGGCASCGFLAHFPDASCIAAPLQVGGRALGALCAARPQHPFDADEARALTLLANAAAVALENARLIEKGKQQAEENAALAERERLAANLHDNLAQNLGAMHLSVDLLADDIAVGEDELARQRVGELQANLQKAYAQVRLALTGLREPAPDEKEFMTAVQTILADFKTTTRLPIQFIRDKKEAIRLTAVTQKQALHILREALTNIRRHAQASRVQVKMAQNEETFILDIADDGLGFDVNRVDSQNHLGLTIMRARTERCQGRLTIHSIPGEGTRVTAVFPTTQTKELEPEAA